jgi:hypothetical protein
MKTIFLLVLTLSLTSSLNIKECQADLTALIHSYLRAVRDWNSIVNFRQAIQETGFAVQYLGWALVDCDPLPSGLFATQPLIEAGEKMKEYSGSDSFEPLLDYVSDALCEEKLAVLIENSRFLIEKDSGYEFMIQSLHDFMATCHTSFKLFI